MKNDLSFLVSTMEKVDKTIIKEMNISDNYVIINQVKQHSRDCNLSHTINNSVWLDYVGYGLSKSRNAAIENCKTNFGLICDDDMVYHEGISAEIVKEFEKNPNYDILAFQVTKKDKIYKKYSSKEKRINRLTSMKVSSVEIALNIKKIKEMDLKFNINFGAGSKYSKGEENIFLNDALLSGLKIKYIPLEIGYLTDNRESSWFSGYNKKYFIDQGAIYGELSRVFSLPLILQFLVRKKNLYLDQDLTVNQVFKWMNEGRLEIVRNK